MNGLRDFDTIHDRARFDGKPLDDAELSTCLSLLADTINEVDRRMGAIAGDLEEAAKERLADHGLFDLYLLTKVLRVQAAALRGKTDAAEGNAQCPFKAWQMAEAYAWATSYATARSEIETH